jgi:3-oxoacyl-[acyl-carrier protein] reductase
MSDWLLDFASDPVGTRLLSAFGLPSPTRLARAEGAYAATPFAGKRLSLGAAPAGFADSALRAAIESAGGVQQPVAALAADAKLDVIVFDATGIRRPGEHRALYDFFHPLVRRISGDGRVLVTAASPEGATDAVAAAAARGVEGFVRTLAKEIGRCGAQANLLYVAREAQDRLEGPVRYFCSAHSTYVDGQPLRIGVSVRCPSAVPFTSVLTGRIAVVTGAARGIGAATVRRLAEEGAHVVCVDLPQSQSALEETARTWQGTPLVLDVSSADAPASLVDFLRTQHGGVDIVVHNAGITRDRTLANMTAQQWDDVSSVNLDAITRLDAALDATLRDEGRIVCLSSQSGIAGNFGQSNYATSKAALIGYVAARAPALAPRGITINAIAPGFIETRMTEAIPFMSRELGRRLSSLRQGGLPRDVAEAICFLVSPGACGITGETLRVCGQSWLGA